jgi:hypothetical protein
VITMERYQALQSMIFRRPRFCRPRDESRFLADALVPGFKVGSTSSCYACSEGNVHGRRWMITHQRLSFSQRA